MNEATAAQPTLLEKLFTQEGLLEYVSILDNLLWDNWVTLGLLLGIGAYLTWKTSLIQVRGFRHSIHLVQGKYSHPEDVGEVSHFQALSTALSATVGTGNIAGVATAIASGGVGALFWMWVTAVLGMATKFVECTLALKFREVGPDGKIAGGPMYTLLHGLNMKRAAVLFATLAMIASFGIGNMVQANSVMGGLTYIFPDIKDISWVIGLIMSISVGLVIIGGVQRIAKVASALVPFMAIVYVVAALIVIGNNFSEIPAAIGKILNLALNPWAVGGAAIGEAIRYGVARGLFSNEAGLGSSPMAHAAARTNEPVREGLVAMMEPFIDTLLICTMTGLVIILSGGYLEADPETLTGAALTAHSFSLALGENGSWVVGFGLCLFAFSTMIAWSYYGDRSAYFLFGEKGVLPYRVIFIGLIVVGATIKLELVWKLTDITNILMALPNLLALILLAGLAKKLSDDYFSREHKPNR